MSVILRENVNVTVNPFIVEKDDEAGVENYEDVWFVMNFYSLILLSIRVETFDRLI